MLRKTNVDSKEIKLHLGCGKRYIPGFIHIDLGSYKHIDYQTSVNNLSMYGDEQVDLIYASHTLEYFDREEALTVLMEWRRVLKKGGDGTLRLSMPDFGAIVAVYQKYNDLEHEGILGPLYGRWDTLSDSPTTRMIYLKTVYDFQSIQKCLEAVGFTRVRKYNWQDTSHADYDDYSQAYIPYRDSDNGIMISLNVEADA